jgi:hypothetical protein
MISDYGAYLMLQQYMNEKVRSALPDAPVQEPDDCSAVEGVGRFRERLVPLRRWLSSEIRHLADRLEPTSAYVPSTTAGHRQFR